MYFETFNLDLRGTWGVLSLSYVSSERLALSTVPHSLAARTIMGQWGRIIMGLIVLFGACGAVNALLASSSRLLSAMARGGFIPGAPAKVLGRPLVHVYGS